MKFLTILITACCVVGSAFAQGAPNVGNLKELQEALQKVRNSKSRSGQFTVCAMMQRSIARPADSTKIPLAGTWALALQPPPRRATSSVEFVEVDPALLAIGCERLKDALLFELGAGDAWRGRIEIAINSALPEGEEPFLIATLHRDGWMYELELPKKAKPDRLLRSLVHVLLLEMANRNSNCELAEVPLWLVEGMTAHLRAFNLPTFLVQEKVTLLGNRIKLDALDLVREHLRHEQALSFQSLSWPDEENAGGRSAGIYRDSAQLLVHQLLHLRRGRAELQNMILALPAYQNWQFTFLAAFRPHFQKLLDVEKWWALTCVSFAGSQATEKWTMEESRKRLQDLLDVPVEVHVTADRMPAAAEITLQEVIQHWEPAAETEAIGRTLGGLQLLRWHCAPELNKIVLGYITTLQNYLHERDRGPKIFRGPHMARVASHKKNVCLELDKLDAQRDVTAKQQVAKKN